MRTTQDTHAERQQTAEDKATARNKKLELMALGGFCVSGLFFVASGLQNGDYLTVGGSLVWIASCLVWMVTYRQ